ncbi:two-component sensor histidine kinase [Streptomyces sp. CB02923]|uniref:sensor histidine kinase n=1 Tax=Streptomyces sp. CB02923 TaxID=1718985 RepID=UPI0009401CAA|nr:histidine kinase [Streptomyces sp. CB02923]OKI09912.1 two-component sensor histidine kinase [Streptomyces sp. CB02923]
MPFTSPTPRPYEAAPPRRRKRRRLAVLLETGTAFGYLGVLGALGPYAMGYFELLPTEVKLALCAGAAALLPFRRRFPVTCLLVLAAFAGALPICGMLTALVAYDAIRRVDGPRRRTVVLFTATVIPVLTAIVGTVCAGYGSWRYGFAQGIVVGGVGILVPGLVGSSRGQQDRLVVALRERAAAAEEARRLIDSASRVEERSRIAAEMHDLVGHRLSLISLHSGGLEMALATKAPELKDEAAQVRAATRDAMNELRAVLGVLGPLGRDTGTEALTDATGTRADIDALAEESRAAGITVTVRWQGTDLDGLEPRVRRAVHRVVRESLTNVHRYATGAAVELTVEHTDDRVRVTVRNGAPPASPEATTGLGTGRGLTGLRERVGLLGGELRTGPTGVGGFLVEATVPARPTTPAASTERPETATAFLTAEEHRQSGALPGFLRHLPGLATGVLGLVGVGTMLAFGLSLVESSRPVPEPLTQDSIHVGMDRHDVESAYLYDNDLARAAAAGHEPRRPGGTDCMFPYTGDEAVGGRLKLTRYCFRADVLTDIDTFWVPAVR